MAIKFYNIVNIGTGSRGLTTNLILKCLFKWLVPVALLVTFGLLVQFFYLGSWQNSVWGSLIWWLPNQLAVIWLSRQVAQCKERQQLVVYFYRAELIKWTVMLITLVLTMKYSVARVDLLLGYIAAIVLWLIVKAFGLKRSINMRP